MIKIKKDYQKSINDNLFYNILLDNYDGVKKSISDGANINNKDANNLSPLWVALSKNCDKIAQLLIINGADLEFMTTHKTSLLMWMMRSGKREVAKLMICQGANLNKEVNKCTPLSTALESCNLDMIGSLILYGVNKPNTYNYHHDVWPYPELITLIDLYQICRITVEPNKDNEEQYNKIQEKLKKEIPIFTLKVLTIQTIYNKKSLWYVEVKQLYPYLFIVHPGQFTKWKLPTKKIKIKK